MKPNCSLRSLASIILAFVGIGSACIRGEDYQPTVEEFKELSAFLDANRIIHNNHGSDPGVPRTIPDHEKAKYLLSNNVRSDILELYLLPEEISLIEEVSEGLRQDQKRLNEEFLKRHCEIVQAAPTVHDVDHDALHEFSVHSGKESEVRFAEYYWVLRALLSESSFLELDSRLTEMARHRTYSTSADMRKAEARFPALLGYLKRQNCIGGGDRPVAPGGDQDSHQLLIPLD